MLEMCGLTVISVVADGCTTNRKFFHLHRIPDYQKSGVTYLAPNISSPSNQVYCTECLVQLVDKWLTQLSGNYEHQLAFCLCNRYCMQNNGGEIKWAHLIELVEKATSNTGLYINKLTREHLILTSYSRMNVHLAAQECSIYNNSFVILIIITVLYRY